MTIGVIDKSLEQQIADIVQRALDDHYQGSMTFGRIRVQEMANAETWLRWHLPNFSVNHLHRYVVEFAECYNIRPGYAGTDGANRARHGR